MHHQQMLVPIFPMELSVFGEQQALRVKKQSSWNKHALTSEKRISKRCLTKLCEILDELGISWPCFWNTFRGSGNKYVKMV